MGMLHDLDEIGGSALFPISFFSFLSLFCDAVSAVGQLETRRALIGGPCTRACLLHGGGYMYRLLYDTNDWDVDN